MLLENSSFKNLWQSNCLGWNFVQCGRIHFTVTKIMNKVISTKKESLFHWLVPRNWKVGADLPLTKSWNNSTKVWQNLLFLSTFPTSPRCYAKGNWKTRSCAWSKLWKNWFVKKQRNKVLVNFWWLLWSDLQFKSLCWHCHRWETSGCEHYLYYLHQTQLFSPEQTRKRRWVTERSHCSIQVSPWRNASKYS